LTKIKGKIKILNTEVILINLYAINCCIF